MEKEKMSREMAQGCIYLYTTVIDICLTRYQSYQDKKVSLVRDAIAPAERDDNENK